MELNGMIERSESMSGAGEAGANLSDLLCCPFCGTAARFIHRGSNNKMDNNWTIGCETDTCFIGSEGADWYLPRPLAAKWWNTRAT